MPEDANMHRALVLSGGLGVLGVEKGPENRPLAAKGGDGVRTHGNVKQVIRETVPQRLCFLGIAQ
ncbi:MAG TPA: hypothetical protein VFG15_18200 [Amycolatopsis sp.]|nr:hypothetical protein [Amycolatopsis sp.]